jgi:hypothetical protein
VNAHQSELNVRVCGGSALLALDMLACRCGYLTCSQTGPCAPPPKDVLPDGWRKGSDGVYWYADNLASLWKDGANWSWATYDGALSAFVDRAGTDRTRAEAMAAALEAARPRSRSLTDRLDLASAVDTLSPVDRRTAINLILTGEANPAEPQGVDYRFPVTAEPELRPGWTFSNGSWVHDSDELGQFFVWKLDDGRFRVFSDANYITLEVAMLRAEELAAERGA